MTVIMEQTQCHTIVIDVNSIRLRCFLCVNIGFHHFKQIHTDSLHFLFDGVVFSPLCIGYGENRKKQANGMTSRFQKHDKNLIVCYYENRKT